ncbi:thioredoxin-like protein [Coniochaeta ligniaria NRRL 30616]|uniref:Protein disulfide-isomerase n=1 Tax=Coniochaeta ligniaria NRRL 30616 TaxID=1408157 RepID=A0A1J7IGR0_9PEZI|nr:thioredoxin-like protein [Coniochaeta ligniaria NRRL 30616]
MSDPVPNTQEGPVTDIVADSYNEVVLNNEKDVVVLFYSPICQYFKAIAPIYSDFDKLLKPYADRITVAKIDATSNGTCPPPLVSSVPTIRLSRSGSKNELITYGGNRTVDNLVKFVKGNGSQGLAEGLRNVKDRQTLEALHDEL